MPRMTGIRITGCKYDGFRKYHENSVYDLTKEGEPDHTLFTLKNQGGKGVLMQVLSQVVLPETRWGKQGGNKITGMFYDHKNRFRPYTFHVMIEWKLDTIPEKWLTTGICITAVKRNYSDEDETEERAGLNYFLYTYEHDENDFFTLENIPAYNPETGKVAEYDEFEQFINEYQRYFIKYSKSSVRRLDSDYYNYLKSRGIHRSEWEVLKLINRHEGGAGNYFSRAADNKAVFDRFIIPAITQNMRNFSEGDQDSLKGIFKSNLSITKNLPVLIEREQDYRKLLSYIEPLIQLTEIGLRRQRILNNSIQEGNNLYAGLNNRLIIIENDILKWQQEREKTQADIRELEYEKDNLEYAREYGRLKQLENRKLELDTSIKDMEDKIEELKIDVKRYGISELLLKMNKLEEEKQSHLNKREQLIKDLNLKDTEEKMQALEKAIRNKWKITGDRWAQISKDHLSYTAFLDGKINELEKVKKVEDTVANGERLKIIQFNNDRDALENKREELSRIFDPLRMVLPEMLLEELRDQDRAEKADIEQLEKNIDNINKKIYDCRINQNGKERDVKYIQSEIATIQKDFNKAKDQEDSLKLRIVSELNLDIHSETYRDSWLNDRLYDIERLIREKDIRLDQLKQSLWENNIDKSLNQEDYWMPNKDVVSIKDRIRGLGIEAQLGTEFLNSLGEEEKLRLIEDFPSIIHGIVIANLGDWELLEENLKDDIFLRSSVPIYIRSAMHSKEKYAFEIIAGDELELVLDPSAYIQWKNNVLDRDKKLNDALHALSQNIRKLQDLTKDIKSQHDKESSETLYLKLKNKEEELEKLKLDNIKLKETIDTLQENLKKTSHKLDTLKKQNQDTGNNINILFGFIERLQQLEAREKEIDEVKEKLKAIDLQCERLGEQIDGYRKMMDKDVQNYVTWKIQVGSQLKEIQAVISDAKFIEVGPKTKIADSTSEPVYILIDEDFAMDISSWENLSKDLEIRNNDISLINKDIQHIEQRLTDVENDLNKIDKHWQEYEPIEGTEDSLSLKKESAETKLEKAVEEYAQLSKILVKVETKTEEIRKQLVKIQRQIKEEYDKATEIWAGVNLDEKEYLIKKGLEENKKYLHETEDIIAAREQDRDNIKDIISDIRIYSELDLEKGKISEDLMTKIRENPRQELAIWEDKFKRSKDQLIQNHQQTGKNLEEFTDVVRKETKDDILKNRILTSLQETKIERYDSNLDSFKSMQDHFQKEINSISSDKAKAEEIRNTWAERASRYALVMVESLKQMVAGMNYVNENRYVFPLLKLRGEEQLPKNEEDVFYTLRDYFVESVAAITEEYDDIENIEDEKIEKMMGDQAIFSRAVRGRYPTLMVYKMTEKNEFRYAKPHDHYYTTWEAINKGEGDLPEGSGGQTLSISTFVIMMLMNYKKRYVGNDNPWTVLMLDNPIGSASGSHVLDPIFEIADKLNFQIIAFAAPEIIKAEISERFPIFWALNIGDEEKGKSGVVTGRVVHGGRVNKV
jgi:hypothetical protein